MYCLHVIMTLFIIITTFLYLYNVLFACPTTYIVFTASFLFSFCCVFVLWFVLLRLRNKKTCIKAVQQLTTFKLKPSSSSFQKGQTDFKSNATKNNIILV